MGVQFVTRKIPFCFNFYELEIYYTGRNVYVSSILFDKDFVISMYVDQI